jgi:hypothetical protein
LERGFRFVQTKKILQLLRLRQIGNAVFVRVRCGREW